MKILQDQYMAFVILSILILSGLYLWIEYIPILGIIGVLIGTIFPYLKYRLDRYTYNRDLFDKRFSIFNNMQNIIIDIHRNYANKDFLQSFLCRFDNEIYNEGQFYFIPSSVDFLNVFRNNLITLSYTETYNKNRDSLDDFFGKIVIRGNLAKKFPELQLSLF